MKTRRGRRTKLEEKDTPCCRIESRQERRKNQRGFVTGTVFTLIYKIIPEEITIFNGTFLASQKCGRSFTQIFKSYEEKQTRLRSRCSVSVVLVEYPQASLSISDIPEEDLTVGSVNTMMLQLKVKLSPETSHFISFYIFEVHFINVTINP